MPDIAELEAQLAEARESGVAVAGKWNKAAVRAEEAEASALAAEQERDAAVEALRDLLREADRVSFIAEQEGMPIDEDALNEARKALEVK